MPAENTRNDTMYDRSEANAVLALETSAIARSIRKIHIHHLARLVVVYVAYTKNPQLINSVSTVSLAQDAIFGDGSSSPSGKT